MRAQPNQDGRASVNTLLTVIVTLLDLLEPGFPILGCQGRSNLRTRGGARVKLSQKSVAVEAIASSLNG